MPPPPTIDIRRATLAELDPLLALEQSSFTSDRISRRQWRRYIENATTAVLVGGRPGGIDAAAVVFYRRGGHSARLYSLAVATRARRAGLGRALLAAVEADAGSRGCDTLRLEVAVDNAAAIALYEQLGYVRGERLARFYEDGADAWRYVKSLSTPAS
ncbi:MAG TPA: N-acetyltransferase [Rhodanobacteraceae bacterium]|nr:N-acetyltransferase [Rhodanobacteraceae bacterium]